jgi:polyisoprenyl-phosphate glycosyltransferase
MEQLSGEQVERTLPLLSIVVPCYNEEAVIRETIRRLQDVGDRIRDMSVEFIFIDDGSSDATSALIRQFSTVDDRLRLIRFSRNFGNQIAVTAGIDAAEGDAVVLIDADLQDPPEVIHDMLEQWRNGYDVVYATRRKREGETALKLITAKLYYRILNYLSDTPIPLDTGDFRLMGRNVINVLKAMPERDRFLRGMASWAGFRQTSVSYDRHSRFAGVSKYSLRKMLRFAMDGIFSFSTKPLKLSIALGVFATVLALAGVLYVFIVRLFTYNWVEGWIVLMLAFLFFGGVQLISIGVLGEYVGRVYNEIKHRPLYVVSEYVGFDGGEPRFSRCPNHSRLSGDVGSLRVRWEQSGDDAHVGE